MTGSSLSILFWQVNTCTLCIPVSVNAQCAWHEGVHAHTCECVGVCMHPCGCACLSVYVSVRVCARAHVHVRRCVRAARVAFGLG